MKHATSHLIPVGVGLFPSELALDVEPSHNISTNEKMRIFLRFSAFPAGLTASKRNGVPLAAFQGSMRKGSRPRSSDHCVTGQSKFAAQSNHPSIFARIIDVRFIFSTTVDC